MASSFRPSRVLTASALAAIGLLVVGRFDYAATRRDLLQALREQAVTLRHTIAAAARANQAAGGQAEAQIQERLLDNARLLAEFDRRRRLDPVFLDSIAARNRLFPVAVFDRDGRREYSSGGEGPGFGAGGRGFPAAGLLQQLMTGNETEAVGELHSPRSGGRARIAAGIRRSNGGVILLNADAGEVEALQRQVSLESLVQDMVASTGQLADVTLDRGDLHIANGDLPGPAHAVPVVAAAGAGGPLLDRTPAVLGGQLPHVTLSRGGGKPRLAQPLQARPDRDVGLRELSGRPQLGVGHG